MEIQAISSTITTLAKTQSTSEDTTASKESSPATQKAGGTPPPPKGGAKPAATSSGTTSSTSSTAKIYDKRDADQDGVVSYQEELLYTLKHPTEETQSQSTVTTSQLKAGLNAYQQSQQEDSQS